MPERIASISIIGDELHYAEVVVFDDRPPRLVRLGSCDFDFDLVESLSDGAATGRYLAFTEALEEVFGRSRIDRLHVALHPCDCVEFFLPMPSETPAVERMRQARFETGILSSFDAGYPPLVTMEPVRSLDEQVAWYHLHRVPIDLVGQIELFLTRLGMPAYQFWSSTRAVSTLLARISRNASSRTPFVLAVGRYPSHAEFTLSRAGEWVHSWYAPAASSGDSPFYVASMLKRLGVAPRRVGRLLAYGSVQDSPHALATLFQSELETLNPLEVFDASETKIQTVPSVFAPCLGASLSVDRLEIV
ncbi:MAG: hypothetical protein AAGI08_06525 [Bacteroidota bacterium]